METFEKYTTKADLKRNFGIESACVAAEKVFGPGAAADRCERGSLFVLNPATGALEVRADLRLKVENAIRAEARRIQFRLYCGLPFLYVRKIGLQLRYAALQASSKIAGYLLDFAADRHR
jgi:hypothetical protein